MAVGECPGGNWVLGVIKGTFLTFQRVTWSHYPLLSPFSQLFLKVNLRLKIFVILGENYNEVSDSSSNKFCSNSQNLSVKRTLFYEVKMICLKIANQDLKNSLLINF